MSHLVESLKQLVTKPAWSDLGYLVAFDAEVGIATPRQRWATDVTRQGWVSDSPIEPSAQERVGV